MNLKDQRESTNFRDETAVTALRQAFWDNLRHYVTNNGHMPLVPEEGPDYFPSTGNLAPGQYQEKNKFHPDGRGPLWEDLFSKLVKIK